MTSLLKALVGSMSEGIASMTLSGSLSASGATATVTGTARTVTVPAGNSGDIRFSDVTIGDSGTFQYQKNGGGYSAISEDLVVTFANGDTLQVRSIGMTSPEIDSMNVLNDDTGTFIESNVTIERT